MIEPTDAPKTGSSAKPSSTTTASNVIHTPSTSSNIDVAHEGKNPKSQMTTPPDRQSDAVGDTKHVEGATHHVDPKDNVMSTGTQGKPRKNPKTGKKEIRTTDVDQGSDRGRASGQTASHTSGIRTQNVDRLAGAYDTTDRGSDDPSRVDVTGKRLKPSEGKGKPQKRGTPEGSKTGGATPKIKAELNLAIIKCKLLKMKIATDHDIIHRDGIGGSKGEAKPSTSGSPVDEDKSKPTYTPEEESPSEGTYSNRGRNTHDAGIDEPVQSSPKKPTNELSGDKDTKHYSTGGDLLGTGKEGKEAQEKDLNKKAPKDIKRPEAAEYTKEEKDKMTNTETSKYPMYKSEDIVSKAVELINIAYDEMNKTEGGTATTSTEGAFNHVYSDVHEAKKQKQ